MERGSLGCMGICGLWGHEGSQSNLFLDSRVTSHRYSPATVIKIGLNCRVQLHEDFLAGVLAVKGT